MSTTRSSLRVAPVLLVLLLTARPASAASTKDDMIELKTQVQTLMDAVARLQQSNDERMGVLRDLVQQTVDSVNKMSITVNGMQLRLQNEGDAQTTHNDQLSGQVQALNDSVDELKARMQRMEKTLGDLQSQAQSTNALLGNLPGAAGAGTGGANSAAPAPGTPLPAPPPSARGTDPTAAAPGSAAGGPPVAEMYRTAYSDYMAAKYPLAASEFSDLIKVYPDDNLAGNAYFYVGEIDARTSKPSAAIKNYDQVIERYPDNAKIPAAHLHKGEALIAMNQREAGVRELRTLVQRFPNSPEAAQARSRLSALGSPSTARR